MNILDEPSEDRELTLSIPEHQVLLSFVNDSDAELFSEWWNTEGWKRFKVWASKRADE